MCNQARSIEATGRSKRLATIAITLFVMALAAWGCGPSEITGQSVPIGPVLIGSYDISRADDGTLVGVVQVDVAVYPINSVPDAIVTLNGRRIPYHQNDSDPDDGVYELILTDSTGIIYPGEEAVLRIRYKDIDREFRAIVPEFPVLLSPREGQVFAESDRLVLRWETVGEPQQMLVGSAGWILPVVVPVEQKSFTYPSPSLFSGEMDVSVGVASMNGEGKVYELSALYASKGETHVEGFHATASTGVDVHVVGSSGPAPGGEAPR